MTTVLLIEDNSDLRENTSEILTLANYQVIVAENGRMGIELAIQQQPDLIICDIMMPEMDGYGVLHILSRKPETALIPFIFLTAKTEKKDIRKGMELGADDYLTKPFDDVTLLNAIEARLRKKTFRSSLYESNRAGLENFIEDVRKNFDMKDLFKERKSKVYKKKSEIFKDGDTPSVIYYVKTGNVKTYRSHPEGKEFITNLYGENEFFGFESVLEGSPYGESAVSLQDTELDLIPKSDFLALINSHTDISSVFISLLCRKVVEKEKQLLSLAYSSVRQRTASALLKMFSGIDGKRSVNLTREDLARVVGTASESVIRVLSEFREEGMIDLDGGKISLLHPAKLEQVVRWNVAR